MPRTRYTIQEPAEPHFLTCSVVGWMPLFSRPDSAQVVLDSLTFLQQQSRLILYGYVLMENHLHLIARADDLAEQIGDFRSYTARQIINGLEKTHDRAMLYWLRQLKASYRHDRTHQLWREGSHPQWVQSEDMMRQKLEYMHDKPVRRGYVDDPTH